jgi:hypothetical protein
LRGAIKVGLAVGAAALTAGYVIVGDHSDYSIGSFSGNYVAASGTPPNDCDAAVTDDAYIGREPSSGTHPVFIYLRGSLGNHAANVPVEIIETAAERGFVAVSIDYIDTDLDLQDEDGSRAQAECIYDLDEASSMASIACARARADCGKGIVTMAHSQGGGYAIVAADVEPSVVAVANIGWINGLNGGQLEASLNYPPLGTRVLPNAALRAYSGEAESFSTTDLNERTGESCGAVLNCLNAHGSGWYKVPNADMNDGSADHCWFMQSGCTESTIAVGWDTSPPTAPWHLRSIVAWLDSKTSE